MCVVDFAHAEVLLCSWLGTMGGSIFLSIIQQFSIPVDAFTCFVLLFNFTIVGVLSLFSGGIPILLRQAYMVCMGIIMAAWFTNLPEWTTWALLLALALYDLFAVLAPGGPLKLLVELASSRDEELPALVYEARPTVSENERNRRSGLRFLLGGVSDSGSVELQVVSRDNADGRENHGNPEYSAVNVGTFGNEMHERSSDEVERLPLVGHLRDGFSSSGSSSDRSTSVNRENEIVMEEEMSPLVDMSLSGNNRQRASDSLENSLIMDRGIRLGLGDFIFYSVLVGRAAMYDLMTVYACYLAIISGLGCTLILLSVCRRALPALPISITLGVLFYFLTRLLMEPFVVGTTTNLLMF